MRYYPYILTLLFFLQNLAGYAQRITNVQATVKDEKVLIGYQVKGLQCDQSVEQIQFYVSKDGKTFIGPLNEVSGDAEPGIRNGKHIAVWDAMREMPFSEERMVFDVRAELKEKKRKRAIMLSYVGNATTPLGGRIGQLGKVSWYIEGRASVLADVPTQYSFSGDNLIDYNNEGHSATSTGEQGWKAYSAIVGTTIQTDCNFFIYLGVGYGFEQYLKKFEERDDMGNITQTFWAWDDSKKTEGVELDGGVIFRYKKLIFSGGITLLNLNKYNWTLGLGVAF